MKGCAKKVSFEAVREIISILTRHRQLTWEMAKRELYDRYTGQVFGIFWSVAHPLILIGVYVFIFAFVFKARVGGTRDMPLDFTTYLLAGLIPWLGTMESMTKGSTVITANASLVKQVVFPIEILPVKVVLSAAITQFVMFVLLCVYVLIQYGTMHWTFVLLPLLFVMQLIFITGIVYVLASVGAYFRDLKDFVQVFCVTGIYLMPIFYLPASVPGLFKPFLYVNPFSYMVWCYQDVIYFGRFEHPWAWPIFGVMSMATFHFGYRVFRKLKTVFGNVL